MELNVNLFIKLTSEIHFIWLRFVSYSVIDNVYACWPLFFRSPHMTTQEMSK